MTTIVEQLSSHAAALQYEHLPREVVHRAKRLIIDAIGCALGGGADTLSLAIVNRIRGAAMKAVELPDVQEAMSRQGLEVETSTPQELAARIKSETAVWAGVIKEAGIRAE